MNQVFKVVYNATLGVWVAVSELSKAHKKQSSSVKKTAVSLAVGGALVVATGSVHAASVAALGAVNAQTFDVVAAQGLVPAGAGDQLAVAIGKDASAVYENEANQNANKAAAMGVAIGYNSTVSRANSDGVSIGANSVAGGQHSSAIGPGATATGTSSTAIGWNSTASSDNTLAFGTQAVANSREAMALGYSADATGNRSTALGASATATGHFSTATGNNAQATGNQAVATGINAVSSALSTIAVGDRAQATGGQAIATGRQSVASGGSSSAYGYLAQSTGQESIATGHSANASGYDSIATGHNAAASGIGAISTGAESKATGANATSTGFGSQATGDGASAYGANAIASGDGAIATGNGAQAAGENAQASGVGAQATQINSIATGTAAQATQVNANALGTNALASKENATAIGTGATAAGENALAMGTGATVNHANGVAIGANSTGTNAHLGAEKPFTIGGMTYGETAGAIKSVGDYFSVGSADSPRQLQNVAAGLVSATSTDGVNGSQLYAVADVLGKGINLLTDAVDGGVSDGDNSNVQLGDSLKHIAGKNMKITQEGSNFTFATKDDVVFDSVDTGDLTVGGAGKNLTVKPGTTVNMGGNVVKGVAPGVDGTDAVNVNQLKANSSTVVAGTNAVVDTVATAEGKTFTVNAWNTTAKAGSDAVTVTPTVDNEKRVLDYTVDLSADTKGKIQDGVNANNTVTNKGITFAGDNADAATVTKKLGEQLDIIGGAADKTKAKNIKVEAMNGKLELSLANNVVLDKDGSLKIGDSTLDDKGLTITDPSRPDAPAVKVNKDGISAGDNKVTNVANGTLSPTSTDAVNGSQLYAEAAKAKTEVKQGENIVVTKTQATDGHDIYTVATARDVNFDNVTVGGVNINKDTGIKAGDKQITNVASGLGDTLIDNASGDTLKNAVNVGDLKNVAKDLSNKGFGLKDGSNREVKETLGNTVKVVGKDGITTTANATSNEFEIGLGNEISIGKDGAPGKVGVKGENGKDGVALDGANGTIGLTGPAGANGQDGASATIGVRDGAKGIDGNNGADGESKTRIVYETKYPNGTISTEEVATLNDGLYFAGNAGNNISKKLNEQLNVLGGITDTTTLALTSSAVSNRNVGTRNNNGDLEIVLSERPTFSGLTVDGKDGNSPDVKFGKDGMSISGTGANGKDGLTIKGADGSDGVSFRPDGTIGNVTAGKDGKDAVNVDQLDEVRDIANMGWNIKANGTNSSNVAPGDTVDLKNTDGNILITKAADSDDVTFNLNPETTVGGAGKDGQPGKDGKVGVKGADGKAGVEINGKDGSIGLTGPAGADGKSPEATIRVVNGVKGLDGNDGAAGESKTRIEYTKPDGTKEQIATMNDGLYFGGDVNTGDVPVARKLTQQLDITGGDAVKDKEVATNNIKVTANNATNSLLVQLAKDINLTDKGSLTIGDSVLNNGGLSITGGPSVLKDGINAGDKKITNVAAGDVNATSTDAVNGSQLYTEAAKAKTEVKAGENIVVDKSQAADGHDIYTVKTARDVDFDNVTVGDVTINKDNGINAGDHKITNVESGLSDGQGSKVRLEDAKGDTLNNAVNVGDLKDAVTKVTTDGFGLKDSTGATLKESLGNAIKVVGKDGITATVNADDKQFEIGLGNELEIGGKDGEPGKVGVKGEDGKERIGLNGKDGSIGLTGEPGADGKSPTATIRVIDGQPGLASNDGKDGESKTRIEYTKADGTKEELATLNDGLKFVGNDGKVVEKKLNETLDIVGGLPKDNLALDNNAVSNRNVGVRSNDGKLEIVLSDRPTFSGLTVDGKDGKSPEVKFGTDGMSIAGKGTNGADGLTIKGVDGKDGVNFTPDGRIGNVTAGVDGKDAVNVEQLKDAIGKSTYSLNVQANGDTATAVKSGDTLQISHGDNMNVARNGNNFVISTKKDVKFDDVKVGDIVINKDDGINAGDMKITGVADGDISATSTDAVNGSQLYNALQNATNTGWNLTANGADSSKVGPNATVDLNNTDGNIQIAKDGNNVTFNLNPTTKVGGPGKDGKDGVDGQVAVNGKDGKAGVQINGKDGSIGLTGPAGADGKDGASATLAVVNGEKGLDGNDGKDGESKTRIEYTKPNGEKEQVATLNDGTKYVGDDGVVVSRKLNKELQVKGGAADKTTAKNIRVTGTQDGGLQVDLANNIKLDGNGSLTIGGTRVDGKGLSIANGPSVTENGISAGGKQITNVAAGKAPTDAVNVSQLNKGIGDVNNRINKVDKKLRAGIAGATAIAFLQRPNEAGKSIVSVGAGGYSGESAVAVGYARNSDNNKISIKLGVGMNSRSDMNWGGSVGYQW
ncbi:hypothetical protein A4G18_08955 [Pasteurellaceae bacterium Pebbles2]|nr:hypothetical protein [Pasteurellaceae bacterium Pebbles2]